MAIKDFMCSEFSISWHDPGQMIKRGMLQITASHTAIVVGAVLRHESLKSALINGQQKAEATVSY